MRRVERLSQSAIDISRTSENIRGVVRPTFIILSFAHFLILVTFLFTILVLVFVIGVLITAVLCIDARVLSSRDRVNGLSPLSPSPLIDMSSSRSSSSSLSSSSDPASLPDSSSCSDPESAAASAGAFLLRRGATSRSFLSARF